MYLLMSVFTRAMVKQELNASKNNSTTLNCIFELRGQA